VRPVFHRFEVVRVARLGEAWNDEDRGVIGSEGVVEEYVGRAEDDDGWELLVWAEEPGEPDPVLWVFQEDELVSTGLLAASEDGRERLPLDPAVAPPELEDELRLWLGTELMSASQAVAASAEIADALQALDSPSDAVVEFERRHEEPLTFDLHVTIQAGSAGFEALGALLGLRPDGWVAFEDDGWRLGASWSRDAAAPGASLLTTTAVHAEVLLMPWSHTRASAARQTLDWPPAM
jgi:hypothetical protein